ncbi:cell division protein FtsL, partial [Falsiroseomonas selenitidurans]
MIRPFTILCFCAFAGAGAWLYQVKHQVATQDRELRSLWRQTEQARDRTAILRAEWALLNEPERLRQAAQRHLALTPMQPQQFTRLPEMERRLPQAIAFAGPPNLFVPDQGRAGTAQVMLAAAQVTAPVPADNPVAESPAAPDPMVGVGELPPPPPAAPPMLLAAVQMPQPARAPARAAPAETVRRDEAPAPQALAATLA